MPIESVTKVQTISRTYTPLTPYSYPNTPPFLGTNSHPSFTRLTRSLLREVVLLHLEGGAEAK
jgi:hypothetical protein